MMVKEQDNDQPCARLPSLPGTYALVLAVPQPAEITVGRLGRMGIEPGCYVYVGSACGPGGLAARLGRHIRREKRLRWHVDYLRDVAEVDEVWYAVGQSCRECEWAEAMQGLPGASLPMARFGASDCRCQSHLLFFRRRPSFAAFARRLAGTDLMRLSVAAMSAVAGVARQRRPDETRR